MDMAPRQADFMAAASPWPGGSAGRAARSLDAQRDGAQAALMMALVWPAIAAMPFFWAPPLWIMAMAAMASGRGKPDAPFRPSRAGRARRAG